MEKLKLPTAISRESTIMIKNSKLFLGSSKSPRSSVDITRTYGGHNLYLHVRRVNIMFAKMVFIICTFSIFEHLFFLIGQILYKGYFKKASLDIIFLTNLSVLFNNSIHLFVFYFFNQFFRIRFKRLFSKS